MNIETSQPDHSAQPSLGQPTLPRRKFLTMAGGAAAGLTLTSWPLGLMPDAAAQGGARSLVCVFLQGGADSFNMFVPLDNAVAGQDYATYANTRGQFAVPASELLPVGDGSFGLNPLLPRMQGISASGRMAVVTNVGPLDRPTTKADYLAQRSLPQSLFAHDAQQKLWQTGQSTLTSDAGWGGSVVAAVAGGAAVAPSFSLSGSNIFQSTVTGPYARLSPTVAIQRLAGWDPSLYNWFDSLDGVAQVLAAAEADALASPNQFDRAAARTLRRSILTTDALSEATADSAANEVGMDDIGQNRLGRQLEQVARLIKNRDALGMPRQVFFVRMGGWDTHGEQAERLPVLLRGLDLALGSFQAAIDDMGIADSVTMFTASDFGRTLTINGDGTDHGWGGHAFVMGGAVQGGTYGTFPSYTLENNPDDVGENSRDFAGRLIPSTSVAQYSATLARWMGLSEPQLDAALPPLRNFAQRDLGFMN